MRFKRILRDDLMSDGLGDSSLHVLQLTAFLNLKGFSWPCALYKALLGFWLSFGFLVACGWLSISWASGDFVIRGVLYRPQDNALEVQTEGLPQNLTESDYRGVTLAEPLNQYVISFPRAKVLTAKDQPIPIRQNGIQSVLFSQPSAYAGALLRISGDSPAAIRQVKVVPGATGFMVYLGRPPQNTPPVAKVLPPVASPTATSPVSSSSTLPGSSGFRPDAALNQIRDAAYQNGSLFLSGRPGDVLVIQNRMVMQNPTRLVLDLERSQLEGTGARPALSTNDPLMPQVRFGQFDAQTVRVVIESSRPEAITVNYPGQTRDKLMISASQGAQPFETLPQSDQQAGYIQDIWVEKVSETKASVKIASAVPMVRQVGREGNTIVAQFPNLMGRDAPVYFDKKSFPFIQKMHVSPLQANVPNVKLSIVLTSAAPMMSQFLSRDGKYLEITLDIPPEALSTSPVPNPVEQGPLPRAPGKKVIVVDAGHGGKDPGATREGIREKDITLGIALKLTKTLESMGYQVVMTRNVDKFLELSQITAITNKVNPDAFVSVHVNSCPNPAIRGFETYFYHPQSRALADAVHKQLVNRVKQPDRSVRSAKFYVINHTPVPAILCEIGYVTHPQDRHDLTTAARQQATADAIARGVTDFLKTKAGKK
jgi:N-acetylmuramoyl-L-alanine amidase